MKRWRTLAQVGLPFLWAGLVLGLSFIETPLKFRAPGITRELGLGIGSLVFTTLNRIELGLALMVLVARPAHRARLQRAIIGRSGDGLVSVATATC